ncbi:MAG: TspO/MBR family protein [Methylocystis sp.]|uniref:TspO/MBR family protein n=1 Tax=Methylocystis sp. TaxID=1911079 RepID=UPI003943D261
MSDSTSEPDRMSPRIAALAAAAPVLAAALRGNFATTPNIAPWYDALVKPALTPPNWLFGPAWTALYALMAYALYRILRLAPTTPGRRAALFLFFAQLALNAAWSFAFFSARSPLLGLAVILPMEAILVAATVRFRRLDRIAGYSLAPTAFWVAFATYLNAGIFVLNS